MNIDAAEDIHRIWDDLSDFSAGDSAAALEQLMTRLADLGGVWNVTWAAATRMTDRQESDPLQGWRVASMRSLKPIPPHSGDGHFQEILDIWDRRNIDPSFLLPLRNTGQFRTYSLRRDLPESWFRQPFYDRYYGSVGIYDAIFVAFPLNQDCESHFGFYAQAPVSDETITRLAYTLRGIKWFHRQLLLNHGLLIASEALTSAEYKVLQLLLTAASEKQVAAGLGISASATRQHVTSLFRKFAVRNRAGLMNLWLNRT